METKQELRDKIASQATIIKEAKESQNYWMERALSSEKELNELKDARSKSFDYLTSMVEPIVQVLIDRSIKKIGLELSTDYGGWVEGHLVYDGENIGYDSAQVCMNHNGLEE